MTGLGPTGQRREVGSLLRAHRERVGLTLGEAARLAGVSAAKLSRLERGLRGLRVVDVRGLCALYEVAEEETRGLLEATQASRESGWWEAFSGLAATAPLVYGLELAADRLEEFAATTVPDLLQTPGYAAAALAGGHPGEPLGENALAELVEARMRRALVLLPRPEKSFHFVVDEVALRRRVGSAAVMAEQCDALLQAADGEHLELQVLPLAAGAHPGLRGGFSIQVFDQARQGDAVIVAGLLEDSLVEHPAQVARYRRVFQAVAARALDGDGSRRLIRAAGRQWRARG